MTMSTEDIEDFKKAKERFITLCASLEREIKTFTKVSVIEKLIGVKHSTMTNRFKNPESFTIEEVEKIVTYLEKIKSI